MVELSLAWGAYITIDRNTEFIDTRKFSSHVTVGPIRPLARFSGKSHDHPVF